MSVLRRRAELLEQKARGFRHPMLPATAKEVITESADLVYQIAIRLEELEEKVERYEQATQR